MANFSKLTFFVLLCFSVSCLAKDLARNGNDYQETMWSGCLGENYSQAKTKALSGDIASIRHFMELSDCSPDHDVFMSVAERGAQIGDEFVTNFYISELINDGFPLKALGYAVSNAERGNWSSRFYVFDIVSKRHIESLRRVSECYVVLNYESDPGESYYLFMTDWIGYSLSELNKNRPDPAMYSIYHINTLLNRKNIAKKEEVELKLALNKVAGRLKKDFEEKAFENRNKTWSSKDFCK